jgi:NAD(P)-dependent dehydrogenase (short-subunit alcohol dehydrogenase family)
MNINFNDTSVFITGGSTGIGNTTAVDFARNGAKVMIADINEAAGNAAVDDIRKSGGIAEFVFCNVADEQSVAAAIQKTIDSFGGLHVAFNNAGIGGNPGGVDVSTTEDWNRVLQVNLNGVYYCMKYQIQHMLKSGGGSIINCSSILGTVGFAGAPAYVASKHAVVGLTKASALDYATQGIRINSIGPGFVVTPLLESAGITSDAATKAFIESMHPQNRLGMPNEISGLVLFLASDAASFITGQHMHADGGYTAR